tara:strand:+ start:1794 stop:2522 length:729 start_codon:yes stop_codon:yes gene_type:complete
VVGEEVLAMTYGLKVTGAGNVFQVDSDTTETFSMAVHNHGNGVYISGLTGDDLVFAHATSSQNGFVEAYYPTNTECYFTQDVNWIVVKASTSTTVASGTTSVWATELAANNYGIQVKNAQGEVCFDSRILTKDGTLVPTEIWAKNSRSGGAPISPSGAGGVYSYTNGTVYTGTLTNKYVSMFGSYVTGSLYNGQLYNGFEYDYTNNKIYHKSYFSSPPAWPAGIIFLQLPNFSEIIVGDYIT